MLTVKDVYDYINSFAPFCMQAKWDNSGMLVGDFAQQVRKIAVSLDITADAVEFAADAGADLIVSHHPVIFAAKKSVYSSDPVYLLAKNSMSAVCAHTSLDIANGGVNDALCEKLMLKGVPLAAEGEEAMVRVAELDEALSAGDFAAFVSEKLSAAVQVSDSGRMIKKIALCAGAGADFMQAAADCGCDAYVTGEAKHHEYLQAKQAGITLITAGHYETENPVVDVIVRKLEEKFGIEVVAVPTDAPYYTIISKG